MYVVVLCLQDIAMSVLDSMLPVVIQSLTDDSDDVRSVAALSLLPVADALVSSVPHQVCHRHYGKIHWLKSYWSLLHFICVTPFPNIYSPYSP